MNKREASAKNYTLRYSKLFSAIIVDIKDQIDSDW